MKCARCAALEAELLPHRMRERLPEEEDEGPAGTLEGRADDLEHVRVVHVRVKKPDHHGDRHHEDNDRQRDGRNPDDEIRRREAAP